MSPLMFVVVLFSFDWFQQQQMYFVWGMETYFIIKNVLFYFDQR